MSRKPGNPLQIRARLFHGEEIAMGPGKVELLDAIRETGSISAAARQMGMSYRRAWLLVDTMNRCFKSPLVSSAAGGTQGGGACLTALGEEIREAYRLLQADLEKVAAAHDKKLQKQLAK
jgi:molybdate transport system regulatory protein